MKNFMEDSVKKFCRGFTDDSMKDSVKNFMEDSVEDCFVIELVHCKTSCFLRFTSTLKPHKPLCGSILL